MPRSVVRVLALTGCVILLYFAFTIRRGRLESVETEQAEHTTPSPKHVTPFTLIDQDGKPFDTASLAGRVWVGSFFFTACPSVCIRLNQTIAAMIAADPKSDVHFVSITCDPDNDTPEMLARYAMHFKADPLRWTFLTGDLEKIKRIGFEDFQVSVQKGEHSDRTFAVDRSGHIRGYYRITEPGQRERLVKLLAKLESEPAPAPDSQSAGTPASAPPTEAKRP